MSWMDSWSRPSKHSATPPPLYLTAGVEVPYCVTCGRIISVRKAHKTSVNVVKYCSDKCRKRKPGSLDKRIDETILALLEGSSDSGIEKTAAQSRKTKGDARNIVTCDEIEEIVFGSRFDPEKVYGRRKNRAKRWIGDENAEWRSVDMEDSNHLSSDDDEDTAAARSDLPANHIRPPQTQSEINFSIGGERGWAEREAESAADVEKRLAGQKRADEREMVRRAARRAVVFGFELPIHKDVEDISSSKGKKNAKALQARNLDMSATYRKCEALMNGAIVEPSFAKGNWSIRWRE